MKSRASYLLLTLLALLAVGPAACKKSDAAAPSQPAPVYFPLARPAARPDVLRQLAFGTTTAADVQRIYGAMGLDVQVSHNAAAYTIVNPELTATKILIHGTFVPNATMSGGTFQPFSGGMKNLDLTLAPLPNRTEPTLVGIRLNQYSDPRFPSICDGIEAFCQQPHSRPCPASVLQTACCVGDASGLLQMVVTCSEHAETSDRTLDFTVVMASAPANLPSPLREADPSAQPTAAATPR